MMSKYEQIKQTLSSLDLPIYRYNQILNAIFVQRIGKYEKMNTLPQNLRDVLVREFGETVCRVTPITERSSDQVGKTLFSLQDGNRIEAIRLHYRRGWESFCISSQCGCGFGCRFCATGAIGLKRNLTADEIADQLLYFYLNGHNLDSISFMGMGEALANPDLFKVLGMLTDKTLFGLSQRRITVSTIGIIPGIRRISKEFPQINLAFSLHSPFEKQRSELMPINKKYPLHKVMEELDNHIRLTDRKVFIAYILLDGINDSKEHAKALAKLLRERGPSAHLYHVDLIPYNRTDITELKFTPPSDFCVRRFQASLRAEGISVAVRAQFGSDIEAGCGQLYGEMKDKK